LPLSPFPYLFFNGAPPISPPQTPWIHSAAREWIPWHRPPSLPVWFKTYGCNFFSTAKSLARRRYLPHGALRLFSVSVT
jgi:hypothetical protein